MDWHTHMSGMDREIETGCEAVAYTRLIGTCPLWHPYTLGNGRIDGGGGGIIMFFLLPVPIICFILPHICLVVLILFSVLHVFSKGFFSGHFYLF